MEGTVGQSFNPLWHDERAICCTASNCMTVLGLTKDSAKIRHLRTSMWKLDRYVSYAMKYGLEKEPEALETYLRQMKEKDEDAILLKCGMWKNPKYPVLSCSPDGILRSPKFGRVLVEVKVLVMEHIDPANFEAMPPQSLRGFYLKRLPDDTITLKKTHKHYYQVQMSLDILELPIAHFFCWSKSGSVLCIIPRDETFFNEKRRRLIAYHREIVVPEYHLRRTVKRQVPITLRYQPFHESEDDDFFLTN